MVLWGYLLHSWINITQINLKLLAVLIIQENMAPMKLVLEESEKHGLPNTVRKEEKGITLQI